ncbi:transcription initiation factor TFIID subunit 12-like [Liolophura sinensis]|uniref:transcription initiation factor TFIID subunit 12-like n=1 Tax=Liolophura sinensis TaxID=3198878 RepID=UPI0031584AF6
MTANLPITCATSLSISAPSGVTVNATPNVNSPALSVPSQTITHVISPTQGKSINLSEAIKHLEQQISLCGSGPHTAQQKEELGKLNTLLYQYKVELQKSVNSKPTVNSESSSAATSAMLGGAAQSAGAKPTVIGQPGGSEVRVLDKRRLQELVKEVDPLEQLDDDVEEVLLQIADDFIESVVTNACHLAKHRKSSTLEAKDVQLHLERNWNMWIPGFGAEELRPYKRAFHTEAHKQRMALIKKTLKKY